MRTTYQLQRDIDDNNSGGYHNPTWDKDIDKQIQELNKLHTAIQNNIEQIDKHKSDGMMTSIMINMVKLQINDLAGMAREAINK